MRTYEPIWRKLKKDATATISAEIGLHATIKKAVIKEKYGDIAYKLELNNSKQKAKLSIATSGKLITFSLVLTPTQITLNDL